MGRFARDINKWVKKVPQELDDFRKAVIFELFSSIIRDTPVDTGRLRGNWQISSNEPLTGEIEITDPRGEVTVARVRDFLREGKIGEDSVTFLTNSLPYAYSIEYDGTSHTKAPEGMVRKNFIRISRNLKNKYG